ncbi:MAG: hypothetical protein AVDCRST_MAG87-2051 [uncultured Thermomicrobiales bacterium]|uniref:Uncharacterized protein n=1 Tax=uncultured Thermomicrobiales bacterium TaxID=1645740 RepID=A0A6J4V3M0_9BACT|nr:MAG: hypothetical protein AVDCRST_MAG87-2051 [uncultured Thermomicrobiales bacterium]
MLRSRGKSRCVIVGRDRQAHGSHSTRLLATPDPGSSVESVAPPDSGASGQECRTRCSGPNGPDAAFPPMAFMVYIQ